MSDLTATRIPRPSDEGAFERCNEVLWRCVLNDPLAQLHGRRGQRQHGVDIVGRRNRVDDQIVGIQCKLKGEGRALHESEVREEVSKALAFRPLLSEFIIATTAPDDAKLQRLALQLSQTASKDREIDLTVRIFGWSRLEGEIRRHPEALKAFDPSHTPSGDRIEQKIEGIPHQTRALLAHELSAIRSAVLQTGSLVAANTAVHSEHERQINIYADLLRTDPKTALDLLTKLRDTLGSDVPGRVRFRVLANIAVCQLKLGDEEAGAQGLVSAWAFDPDNPKAVANRAFGLLLLGDLNGLKMFASERLQEHSDNPDLAAYYIQSVVHDELISDPLAHVPEAVRGTPEVAAAQVRWLMERGDHGAWWDAAISAYREHPDDTQLQELFACALLERVVNGVGPVDTRTLTANDCIDVEKSVALYEKRWREICGFTGHLQGDSISVAMNLMCGYRLLGKNQLTVEVGNDALGRFPDSVVLRERLAVALAEQGEAERGLELVAERPINAQIAPIRYNVAMANEDWEVLAVLADHHLESFPETERGVARVGGAIAKVELAATEDRRSILRDQQVRFEGDTRALTVLAECARRHGFDDLASEYFEAANAALERGDNTFACRRSLALEAMAQRRPGAAADVLAGHVAVDHDSSELRLLGQALVNDYPIRDRAVDFFDQLPHEVRSLLFFRCLEGVLHINRGVPEEAIGPFTTVFEHEPSIEHLIYLVRAHLGVGDKNAVVSLLQEQSVDTLQGFTSERLDLCDVFVEFEETARALDLGYRALIDRLEDSSVVMRFLGLVLGCTQHDSSLDVDVVGPGVWVRLTQKRGDSYETLVDEAADRPWGAKGDPDNAFISQAIGKEKGDCIEFRNPVTGATEKWTVADIKPRWLQAFHYLSSTFNQTYPEATGFASVPIADGEIAPVLDLVRRRGEEARVEADLYLEKNLPMEFVAKDRPGGSIEFARYIASIGQEVRVCIGTQEELAEALMLIDQHGRAGAVIDAFTAWHASALSVLDVLRERLGSLAIPTSELRRIRVMVRHYEGMVGEQAMGISYRDGQYVREVANREMLAERLVVMKQRIEKIEEACSVEPLVVPDRLSELGEALIRPPIGDAMAAAVIAETDRILLSEDLMIRQLAEKGYGAKGVWLQVVLLSAFEAGTLSVHTYADAVGYLAAHRHGQVSLALPVLLSIYERDRSDDLALLRALCVYIGNKNADLDSHIKIAAGFVNVIVNSYSPEDPRVRSASGMVFDALLDREDEDQTVRWVAACYSMLTDGPRASFVEWCRAHDLQVET